MAEERGGVYAVAGAVRDDGKRSVKARIGDLDADCIAFWAVIKANCVGFAELLIDVAVDPQETLRRDRHVKPLCAILVRAAIEPFEISVHNVS